MAEPRAIQPVTGGNRGRDRVHETREDGPKRCVCRWCGAPDAPYECCDKEGCRGHYLCGAVCHSAYKTEGRHGLYCGTLGSATGGADVRTKR